MKCSRCGNENGSDALFCTSCGTKLDGTNQVVDQSDYNNQLLNRDNNADKKDNNRVVKKKDDSTVYLIIYGICMFCAFFPVFHSSSYFSSFFYLVGLLDISVAKVRCESKLVNTLFWITILLFVAYIILIIIFIITCYNALRDCNMSG